MAKGTNTAGGNYGVYLTPPSFPASVTVGSTGVFGTLTLYTDSTKTIPTGQSVGSYVVEPDTATTAIVNQISKNYNASGVLTLTEQDRYRIAATGTPVLVSIDTQAANGSTTHLVFQ
ncbi:hypothetical protein [Rhodoferax sp. UBA5149]|uniref:hypothetical protein n=1 Tax=Rhodoferax sp. UBA5149 TaxID=1947379 RepID=UPI0025D7C48C|nr:hypothetical protein [Rhodoferax sp. UBA5149]